METEMPHASWLRCQQRDYYLWKRSKRTMWFWIEGIESNNKPHVSIDYVFHFGKVDDLMLFGLPNKDAYV